MKKYIYIAFALLCAVNVTAQKTEKIMVIHKSDGTKIKTNLFFNPDTKLEYWGKHTVNDGDYVWISQMNEIGSNIVVQLNFEEDLSKVGFKVANSLYASEDDSPQGVLWSTEPEVTLENAQQASRQDIYGSWMTNKYDTYSFDYELGKTYYVRAYVTVLGTTYYSEEETIRVLPSGWGSPEFADCGYVVPTDDAFMTLFQEQTTYKCNQAALYQLQEAWRQFLTPEKSTVMDKTNAACEEYRDCKVYFVEYVDESFVKYLNDRGFYDMATYFVKGDQYYYEEYSTGISFPTEVICDSSLNIYGNAYWIYSPVSAATNPQVALINGRELLPGEYKISIIFAPETTNDTISALPHKVRLTIYEADESGEFPMRGVTIDNPETGKTDFTTDNVTKCDTISFDWKNVSGGTGDFLLQVKSNVRTTENKTYTRFLRIVGMFVEKKK